MEKWIFTTYEVNPVPDLGLGAGFWYLVGRNCIVEKGVVLLLQVIVEESEEVEELEELDKFEELEEFKDLDELEELKELEELEEVG